MVFELMSVRDHVREVWSFCIRVQRSFVSPLNIFDTWKNQAKLFTCLELLCYHYIHVQVPSQLALWSAQLIHYQNFRSYSAKLRSFWSASRRWPHPPRRFRVGTWTSLRQNRAVITTQPTQSRDSASTCESSTSWTARWYLSLWTRQSWRNKGASIYDVRTEGGEGG